MNKPLQIPFYLKISQIILGIIAFIFVLYIGQAIILPLIYSLILAILMNPAVNYLLSKKVNKIVAISIVLLVTTLLLLALIYFISAQIVSFGEVLPQLKSKFNMLVGQSTDFISRTFHVDHKTINGWIDKGKTELGSSSSVLIGQTLSTFTDVVLVITLLPVYIFMFLYYKPLLLEFISKLSPPENRESVGEVLVETRLLVQSYLSGLLLEAVIVSALNALGLFVLGVDYALLIGIIGGILNIIPYLGGIIATAIPMLLALATKSPTTALLVLGVYLLVQFIDNNYLMPVIVASRVKINALFSVIVVLIGGALWGIAGMFLAIPLTALVKVIFDRVDSLEPFGFLLGDSMPKNQNSFLRLLKKKSKDKKVETKAKTA
ncbi:MAG: AI-2E family transporter [Bacteroidetes bacterium]|nr:AI-2E family transporter [Bacteroidota bacterium]